MEYALTVEIFMDDVQSERDAKDVIRAMLDNNPDIHAWDFVEIQEV